MINTALKSNYNLFNPVQYQFAKSLKIIKIRMKAVSSIKKITKAMKMVAASKMKQDVARLERAKFYGVGSLEKLFQNQSHLQKRKPNVIIKKSLIVPITTDRGLCGGTNSGVIRDLKQVISKNRQNYKVFVIGDKGSSAIVRPMPELVQNGISNVTLPLYFPAGYLKQLVSSIAHHLNIQAVGFDNIIIIYNHFKNVISQIVKRIEVMNKKTFLSYFNYIVKHDSESYEKNISSHLFYEFYLATTLYNAYLNNLASQTSARMNAMENASKNAGEILQKLTLQYNKARQAKITQQLCEIISGAAAV